jgi:hypothetical protein
LMGLAVANRVRSRHIRREEIERMRREGDNLFRADRPIGRAKAGTCGFDPLPSAAVRGTGVHAGDRLGLENYYDLSKEAELRLWELCRWECYSEALDGFKLWGWMRRREDARRRIVGALRAGSR